MNYNFSLKALYLAVEISSDCHSDNLGESS
jgi:hypothetical protein